MDEESKICNEKDTDEQHTWEYLQNDSEKISIHILNNDCLRYIFEFLPISDKIRAERVCKRWKAVSLESWHTMRVLDFSTSKWGSVNMDRICSSTLYKLLLRCGRFLTRFDLSEPCNDWLHEDHIYMLNTVGKLCPNLMDVDLNGIEINYFDLRIIATEYKNITKFTIGRMTHDFDDELSVLFRMYKNLEYLQLHKNMTSGDCLTFLSAETMRTLILYECDNIYYSLSRALKRLRGLEQFVLYNCTMIQESTLRNISQYCTNLKLLDLHRSFCGDRIMTSLSFTKLVKLEHIRITHNNKISDDDIAKIALNCQELIDIDITGCQNVTNAGLASIATLLKLERLNINYITGITDQGLHHIHDLKVFKCRACTITEEGLSVMLASSPQLRLLDISDCDKISKHFLEVAKEVCNRHASNVLLQMIVGEAFLFGSPAIDRRDPYIEVSPFLQIIHTVLWYLDMYRFSDRYTQEEEALYLLKELY